MPKAKQLPIELLKTAYTADQLMELRDPAVIFVGRSNAGKSSLINALTRSQLAQVSKRPGKTRSINYFRHGSHLILVDLPGFGYARRAKAEREDWATLVRAFFDHAPAWIRGFLTVDCQRDLETEELELLAAFRERSYPVEILLTKADRMSQSERHRRESLIKEMIRDHGWEGFLSYRFVSVRNGEGIEALRRAIYRYEKENLL